MRGFSLKRSPTIVFATALLVFSAAVKTAVADAYKPFEGEQTAWHDGFDRYDFVMDAESLIIKPCKRGADERFGVKAPANGERRCIVVAPKTVARGAPWSWRGCYWDHEPQTEIELLRRGFHVCFITPDPDRRWDAWYAWLTGEHGLSKKPAFIGMSMGGVNAYEWSTRNPEKVSCIYADNPAIRRESFAKLDQLAKHNVALFHVCGSLDFLLEKHTAPIESRYRQLGGRMTVIVKEGAAHHPHSLRDPKRMADWIEQHAAASTVENHANFADEKFAKSYFYSPETSYIHLPEEDTYAAARGPGFVACYARYDAKTDSRWDTAGMGVIAPNAAATGKPWVFRAGDVDKSDSAIDQALLAKGFHIVIAPLVAQSGPVRGQWDATYRYLVDHGFSKRPMMEGAGTAAGEIFAWAMDNPEKVSCVYVENAALRSLMTTAPLVDRLDGLAKAGAPLLLVSGSLDPWLETQSRVIEQKYRGLGGASKLFINQGVGHYPSSPRDVKSVVDLILDAQR